MITIHLPCLGQDVIWNESWAEGADTNIFPEVIASLPVSVNRVSEEQLHAIQVLDKKQIRYLMWYRKEYGKIISRYELQMIPGITKDMIRKLELFLIFDEFPFDAPMNGIKKPGFPEIDLITLFTAEKNSDRYEKMYRCRIHIGQQGRYQADLRMDQDHGEKWLLQPPNQWGFDHVSGYIYIPLRKTKLILGDFRVHAGQGLVQNGAFRMGKGSSLPLPVLSNYISPAGTFSESQGLSGIAGELELGKWNTGFYVSRRREDASLRADDTFTTLSSDGLHRTEAELSKRKAVGITSFGAYCDITYRTGMAGIAFNSDVTSVPVKHTSVYKQAFPQGIRFFQFSIHGNYRIQNLLTWFEIASQPDLSTAFQTGASVAIDRNFEFILLYRRYAPAYFSFYGKAFGERGSSNHNEEGGYAGITYQKGKRLKISGYADLYRFPWYSYRRNTALSGCDLRLDAEWRKGELRIRAFVKSETRNSIEGADNIPEKQSKYQLHVNKRNGLTSELRIRLQMNQYRSSAQQKGYLGAIDYIVNQHRCQWNFRLMYFNTAGYQSREFSSERDVWGSFSLPSYFGRGFRSVVMLRIKFRKRLTAWLRYAVSNKSNEPLEHQIKIQTKLMI